VNLPSDVRVKHVPIRQCVGCRRRLEKGKLTRYVRTADGAWHADPRALAPGRGAYLCSPECMQRLKKNKRYKGLLNTTEKETIQLT
jgi:predicted RNA-binding protein YlxR (DUF448 family)